jgi:hypothetical protein
MNQFGVGDKPREPCTPTSTLGDMPIAREAHALADNMPGMLKGAPASLRARRPQGPGTR